MKDIIVIGDRFKDLSMIKASGLSIAIQNTLEDTKDECDIITDCTNSESAIAEVINKYIL